MTRPTSNINYTGIDQLFPVAGQDNDSQGFRDNFATIKSSLQTAYNEITELQANAVITSTLGSENTAVQNDLQGSSIESGSFKDFHTEIYTHDASDNIVVDVSLGDFQLITLTNASSAVTFSGWPSPQSTSNGLCAKVRVHMTVSNNRATATPNLSAGDGTLRYVGGMPSLLLSKDTNGDPIPKVIEVWSPDEGVNVYVRYVGEFLNGTDPNPNNTMYGDLTLSANDALLSVPQGEVSTFNLSAAGLSNLTNVVAGDLSVTNGTIVNGITATGAVVAQDAVTITGTLTANGNVNLGNTSSGGSADKVNMVGLPIMPKLTTAERDGLTSIKEAGMFVFNTDTNVIEVCDGNSAWRRIDPNHSVSELTDGTAVSLTTSASWFATITASTATLAAGFEGQIKRFAMTAEAGAMVITVASGARGWGGAGTITFDTVGQGCTLQFLNGKWYCVGNNGAVFA